MPETRPALVIAPLQTERLDLTLLDPAADAPALHAMLSSPEVHRYDVDSEVSASVDETERRLRLQVVANGGTSWAVRLRGDEPIGTIVVFADQGTRIRGVGWSLSPSYWGRGIMSEAARAAIPYLLGQAGVDGVEAWADSANLASVGVARAAGLSERGRLPRVYADRVAQTVVLARAARPEDPEVLGVVATLEVHDLQESLRVLQSVLRLHLAWSVPEPPVLAFLATEPWSGAAGLRLAQATRPVVAGAVSFDVGVSVDVLRTRVVAAGLPVVQEPVDTPWFRREMTFRLPEGHLVSLSGPASPPDAARG